MTAGAIIMMLIGCGVVWGGLITTIVIAIKKGNL
ncbi:MetS family NSS transporter small subunit [Fusobacterium perfoetens]|nr:MetS family NSS transporter small subunit [Fusobacterium perfoetens]MCF2626072.1 MetS family NSS transporter small subunit [Fusobacterium perfoetens]